MYNPFKAIENLFYKLRGVLWQYPEYAWERDDSFFNVTKGIYLVLRPYSHFLTSIIFSLVFVGYLQNIPNTKIIAKTSSIFVEGVVVGVDSDGNLQSLSKVNPLYPTLIQLERDLNELIYEPLIVFEQNGTVTPRLAKSISIIQQGADYEFQLREDAFWHDSTDIQVRKFGIEDVIRTLEIISQIETPEGLEISYVQAVKQMGWERVGTNAIRICTTTPELQATLSDDIQNKKCSGTRGEKPILANFLELVSFKIMPAHLTVGLSGRNIYLPGPAINKRPVGTSNYKFDSVGDDTIALVRNNEYYGAIPKIEILKFKLFRSKREALEALQNGEIHAFSTSSTDSVREMSSFSQVNILLSPVLSNQYWALYFNLRTDLDGNAVGPEFLQSKAVRRAISSGINRTRILKALLEIGEEAHGPIYIESEYFNVDAGWYGYNPDKAGAMLNTAGWIMDPNLGLRKKENVILSFKLSYVSTPDRTKVVESIRQDLLSIGIEVIPEPLELEELFSQVVSPKLFDTLLYGMNTFIDPDRYELFHSEESLNLSSYAGSDKTIAIKGNDTVKIPRVDKLLDRARSFDPAAAKNQRKEDYILVQELIAADAPVVFLYHPQFVYFVNNRVVDVNLRGAYSLEQRFVGIEEWRIRD